MPNRAGAWTGIGGSAGPATAGKDGHIQLDWLWLRYQRGSALAGWFRERVGALAGRTRRIEIVEMARKLLIALWSYAKNGLLLEGVEIAA